MMKLIIGNRRYSSWSLRGWLAVQHSGLACATEAVPMYDADWPRLRATPPLVPGDGKVPILWDGDVPIWDSLAILLYVDAKSEAKDGKSRFWPQSETARALAYSMVCEMHASFTALRQACPMNLRRDAPLAVGPEVLADVTRITQLWAQAHTRFGEPSGAGDFLFGGFGAADIAFAPVVCRFLSYHLPLDQTALAYCQAVRGHPLMVEWYDAAAEESWHLPRYDL